MITGAELRALTRVREAARIERKKINRRRYLRKFRRIRDERLIKRVLRADTKMHRMNRRAFETVRMLPFVRYPKAVLDSFFSLRFRLYRPR